MREIHIVNRQSTPIPWDEGEKIPWNDPGFSRRMLQEHLAQCHDAASRRFQTIDRHVRWIHQQILLSRPGKILDLGCGPGLYTSRLAKMGHTCVGIDFSPASIEHAREQAQLEGLQCTYFQEDIRAVDFGSGFDLVMFIFGEFNVFRPADAGHILEKAYQALVEGGCLLLEVQRHESTRKTGEGPPTWYTANSGLFSDQPHICLYESFWDDSCAVSTERYFTIDAMTGEVARYAASTQAYTLEQYRSLLESCGFKEIAIYSSLDGKIDDEMDDFFPITARKAMEQVGKE